MNDIDTDNPITLRLKKLGELWNDSMEDKAAALTVWRVPPDQDRMVDGLVYFEDSEAGVTPSIFFTFESDFTDHEKYAFDLIKELLGQIGRPEIRASIERSGADIDALSVGEIRDTTAWLKLLHDFASMIDILKGHFVAYLLPKQVEDQAAWLNWLERLLSLDIPDQVKIMVKEDARSTIYDNLLEDYPEQINLLEPKLDMHAAYAEILAEANKGKENEPGSRYQVLCLEINKAIADKDMSKALTFADEATALTRAEKWPNLEIAIYFLLANGYLGERDLTSAKAQYLKGREMAKEFAQQDPAIGHQLEVHSIMGVAGVTLGEQDYVEAAQLYASSAPIARKIDKPNLALEAHRMSGFCHQQAGDFRTAWDQYELAWKAGKQLDESARLSTTMPYVAKSLLEIRERSGADVKQYVLEDKIAAGLGANWPALIADLE